MHSFVIISIHPKLNQWFESIVVDVGVSFKLTKKTVTDNMFKNYYQFTLVNSSLREKYTYKIPHRTEIHRKILPIFFLAATELCLGRVRHALGRFFTRTQLVLMHEHSCRCAGQSVKGNQLLNIRLDCCYEIYFLQRSGSIIKPLLFIAMHYNALNTFSLLDIDSLNINKNDI